MNEDAILRECLSKLTFYRPDDEVFAIWTPKDALCAGYNNNMERMIRRGDVRRHHAIARMNLQVEGPVLYVVSIEVAKPFWRMGFGRQLLGCAEQFAFKMGCKVMRTTPSGMGTLFWPAMGFVPAYGLGESEKVLDAK